MKTIYVIPSTVIDVTPDVLSIREFIQIAKIKGKQYSLNEFEKAFNEEEINSNTDFIRII